MKKLLILALFFAAAYGAHAQVPISKMPTFTGDPTGSYVPIIVNGVNRKIDARYFGYTQASYVQRKIGTDSLFWVSGDGVYHFISRMDTSGVIKTGRSYIDSSLAQMLAHDTAQIGDISIRSDSSISYVLHSLPSSSSGNWYKLRFPAAVPSVFGRTGAVGALAGDYNHTQITGVDSLFGLRSAYVADITTLENYTGNSNTVIVQDSLRGGTFNYVASATPDSGTVFKRYGGGYWQRNYKGAMNSQWFGGINAAITGIGAKNALLHISQAETLAANTTIPANVAVEILKGGSINVPSGDTLTINGTFKAGRYQVFSGSGLINFGSSSIDSQFPEWDGAKADGSNYCTAMFAKEYARNMPISLGVGNYLVDSITTGNLNYPLVIKGQGMKVSKITVAYGNVNGIWIGEQQTVANSVLKDFLISGHVGNKGGIALGNGTVTYNVGVAANTLIENVEVYNFSDTGQFGIELNEVQELNVHNCYLYQNWNNYWRPNYGFVTSTLIDGKAGYDGYAYNRGADLEGVINDITFKDQVFENNQNEAVYYNRIDGSPIINIQGNYFESNNKSGTANGIVSISGNQTSRFRPVAIIRNNVFYDPGDTTHTKVYLNNTHNSVVADNSGNMYPMQVTAGTNCYFNNNASFISGYGSAPMKNMYTKMYAISNKIIVDDWDTLGVPFHLGTLNLNTKAYYSSNPTFTPADSNSVINKRYADSLQALNLQGTGQANYLAYWNGPKGLTYGSLYQLGSYIYNGKGVSIQDSMVLANHAFKRYDDYLGMYFNNGTILWAMADGSYGFQLNSDKTLSYVNHPSVVSSNYTIPDWYAVSNALASKADTSTTNIYAANGVAIDTTLHPGHITIKQDSVYEDSTVRAIAATEGTYTPTITGVANYAAGTSYVCRYVRTGKTVTVYGKVTVQPTATATITTFSLSLPIASTFTDSYDAAGTGGGIFSGTYYSYVISSASAGSVLNVSFVSNQTSGQQDCQFTATYKVL